MSERVTGLLGLADVAHRNFLRKHKRISGPSRPEPIECFFLIPTIWLTSYNSSFAKNHFITIVRRMESELLEWIFFLFVYCDFLGRM